MESFSSARNKPTGTQHSRVLNDVRRIEHEGLKQRFGRSLSSTRHDRSADFNTAIDRFDALDTADIEESDLRPLVHGCMLHGATAALREILPLYEGLEEKVLHLEGPIDERGWKTLVEAIEKNSLLVESLALWNLKFDCSKGELLFEALAHMPKLHRMELGRVGVESDFGRSECPPLKLHSITVYAGSTDDFPLLLKVLGSCTLLELSLVDEGKVTTFQHERLGQALQEQVKLKSLRFACLVQKNFIECCMPFLKMKTSLKVLEVKHFDLEVRVGNELFKMLPHSKAELRILSLAHCNLQPCEGPDGRLHLSHLAGLRDLLELDLSDNPLTDEAIEPLLRAFEGAEDIKLRRLNLNNTKIDNKTADAMGSLLSKNRTLVSLGFISNQRRDDFFLKPLVPALQHNTTLLQLQVSALAVGAWRAELRDHLARNREAFKKAVAEGMRHGMSVLLGSSSYPDLVNHIIDLAEFSDKDALALSSLHPRAWAERHKALQAGDAST